MTPPAETQPVDFLTRRTALALLAQNAPSATDAAKIPRLKPGAFPQLPAGVAKVLLQRGCLIPQPSGAAGPANLIRGHFFTKAQAGWAAMCSDGAASAILVFRSDTDANPEEMAKADDCIYVTGGEGGQIGYSRMIGTVGRKFIMDHYRAYGGPKPPPVDHDGIDDAILEKASVVRYRYAGKWLELTGSD